MIRGGEDYAEQAKPAPKAPTMAAASEPKPAQAVGVEKTVNIGQPAATKSVSQEKRPVWKPNIHLGEVHFSNFQEEKTAHAGGARPD